VHGQGGFDAIHFTGVLEQPDVSQDGAQSVELRISHRVLAIARGALNHCWTQRPVQCHGDLLGDLVLEVG